MKLSLSADFRINLSIQNFIPFLVLQLCLLSSEEQQSNKARAHGAFSGQTPLPMSSAWLLFIQKSLVSQASAESQKAGSRVSD